MKVYLIFFFYVNDIAYYFCYFFFCIFHNDLNEFCNSFNANYYYYFLFLGLMLDDTCKRHKAGDLMPPDPIFPPPGM